MTKLKNSNFGKTEEKKLKKKIRNLNCDYSKTQIVREKKSRSPIVTKLKKNNCDKNLRKSNCYKSQKLKFWQKSKNQIVTVVTIAVVAAVIVTYFSKNNLTPQQQMKFSQCSFLRFLRYIIDKHCFYNIFFYNPKPCCVRFALWFALFQ